MNRRSFIKAVAAATTSAFIVPEIIVAEKPVKRFWALGGLPNGVQIVPSRMPGDDTAFVQWHIDNNEPIPCGLYDINSPVMVRDKTNQVVDASGTIIRVHGNHKSLLIGENLQGVIITGFHMQAMDDVEYGLYLPA